MKDFLKDSQPLEENEDDFTLTPEQEKTLKRLQEEWEKKKPFEERVKEFKEKEAEREAKMSEDEKNQRELMNSIEEKLDGFTEDLLEIKEYVENYKDIYHLDETKRDWERLYNRIERVLDSLLM